MDTLREGLKKPRGSVRWAESTAGCLGDRFALASWRSKSSTCTHSLWSLLCQAVGMAHTRKRTLLCKLVTRATSSAAVGCWVAAAAMMEFLVPGRGRVHV